MNCTKLLGNINTFEDYISVSRNISDPSQQIFKNPKFNASTLRTIKKLVKFEIEYFKEYDENGAAFVVFREALQMSPSQTMTFLDEDTTSVISKFLEAIINGVPLAHDKKWKFLDKLMQITVIFCEKNVAIHTSLTRHISEPLLSLATSKLFNCQQKIKILKCLNACSHNCSRELRQQTFQKFNTYFIQLAHYIVQCEDYYGQVTIMYTLMKWFTDRNNFRKRAMIAKEWFPHHLFDRNAVKIFIETPGYPFGKFIRRFLNSQNEVTKLIVSVPCNKVLMGNKLLVSDENECWLDLSVISKRLTVMSNIDEMMKMDHQNISAVEFKRHPDYILSIQLNKLPEILTERAEHIQAALDVTIFIKQTGDMTVFKDTLQDIMCEKLKLPSVQNVQAQPRQSTISGKGTLYFRGPSVIVNATSSVSSPSVQQLRAKIMATPHSMEEGRIKKINKNPIQLPDVKELSEHNTTFNIDDRENDNRQCVETVASKLCRLGSSQISEIKNVPKEQNTLKDIVEKKGNTINQLTGKVSADNITNETNKDKNENNVQKPAKTNKNNSKMNVNGFHVVEESNSDSAISATPMFVNNRTGINFVRTKTTNDIDISLKPLNAEDVEIFFSQHYRDANAVISPTLASRLNRSSSDSEILEYLGGNQELIQTNDLISTNQKTINLKTPIVNSDLDVKINKSSDHKDSPLQKNTNEIVAPGKEKAPDSLKVTVEKGKNFRTTNNDTVLVLDLNHPKKYESIDSEKENGISVDKKSKRKEPLASLKVQPKQVSKKSTNTRLTNKKRRTLFSNELLQENMQQNEDNELQELTTQNVEPIITQNETKKISTSIYDQIEKEKPKRQNRQNRLRSRNLLRKSPVTLSPRAKKMDDMFEKVKNSDDINPISTKNILQDTKDIAMYNYSSDSDNDFKADTSVKTVVKAIKKNNRGRPLTNKKSFTERTKKTQAKKKKIKKGKLKSLENNAINKISNDVLIDETVREANVDNLVDTSVILENIDTDQFLKMSQPKLNKTPVMESMSATQNTKPSNRRTPNTYKGAKKNTLSKKKEKSERIGKKVTENINQQVNEKSDSPIPQLVIETVSSHDNVKDSSLLTNLESKIKKICKNTNEITEDITESAFNITDNKNIYYEAPLEQTVHLEAKTASKLSPRVEHVTTENILQISSSNGDKTEKAFEESPPNVSVLKDLEKAKKIKTFNKLSPRVELIRIDNILEITISSGGKSEKTIHTLKTKSAIDAHGDSEEFPPNISVLTKNDTPRDLETEELNIKLKRYHTNLATKLNALHDKNFSDNSIRSEVSAHKERSSSGSCGYNIGTEPKVILERLPKRLISEFSTNEITPQRFPDQYFKSSEIKEKQSKIRKTIHKSYDSNKEKKSHLRTSSPKSQNHDLMFDLRHLAEKVSPIKNIQLKNTFLDNSLHSNSSHDSVTKKTRDMGHIGCKELVNLSRNFNDMTLPVSDIKLFSKKKYYLRSDRESSDSEKSEHNTKDKKESVSLEALTVSNENCDTETVSKCHLKDCSKLDKIDNTGSPLQNDLKNMFNHLLQVATADCGDNNQGLKEIRMQNKETKRKLEKNLDSVNASRSNNMSVNDATKASEFNCRKRMVENESKHLGVKRRKIFSNQSEESTNTVEQWINSVSRSTPLDKESSSREFDDYIVNVIERFNTTMVEAGRETSRRLLYGSTTFCEEMEQCINNRIEAMKAMLAQWLAEWEKESQEVIKKYLKTNKDTLIQDAKIRQAMISLVNEDLEQLRRDIAASRHKK